MKYAFFSFVVISALAAADLRIQPPRTGAAFTAKRAAAEEPSRWLSAPLVGYSVETESRTVRLILGVPGSTHYSEPIAFPEDAASVRTAPGHRWLLVQRGEEAAASAWSPETGGQTPLAAVTSEPGLIAISPAGATAVFYWPAAHRLAVYSGLPDAPVLAADAVSDAWTGPWTALSVSDSGTLVAGLHESGELRLLLRDRAPSAQLIREARPVASFGYFGADGALAVADAGSDRLELVGSFGRRLLQLPAPITSKARLEPGGSGWFFLADAGTSTLHRLELGGTVRTVTLGDSPLTAFEALRTRGALLLHAPEGDAARIVLSHEAGDDLFYLPTLTKALPAESQEEVQ